MLGNPADTRQKEAIAALQDALKSGNETEAQKAWQMFHTSVVESVKTDYEMAHGDERILAKRGYRQLTGAERKFYQNLIKAGKSENPKQAFSDLVGIDGGMPETIIEDVYRELTEQHPLLNRINFQNVRYLTRWILNDHTEQSAVWGEINDEITKEITSGFRSIDLTLCKLSAFAVIEMDMLDLGPEYLDNYVRTILRESLYCALEAGIVSGTGHNEPIGLDRDIHEGVSYSTSTGYPRKTAVKITSFAPAEYGPVLANLAVTERGKMRSFDQVTLICNMVDYLTKVMPATTVLNANGVYAKDLFPFPTETIRSNAVSTGEAILCLPEEYFMGIGGNKDGNISYDDSVKFLEDMRTFKIKLHGTGRAYDNTVALLLDISELDPAYITVLAKTEPEAQTPSDDTGSGEDDEETDLEL